MECTASASKTSPWTSHSTLLRTAMSERTKPPGHRSFRYSPTCLSSIAKQILLQNQRIRSDQKQKLTELLKENTLKGDGNHLPNRTTTTLLRSSITPHQKTKHSVPFTTQRPTSPIMSEISLWWSLLHGNIASRGRHRDNGQQRQG